MTSTWLRRQAARLSSATCRAGASRAPVAVLSDSSVQARPRPISPFSKAARPRGEVEPRQAAVRLRQRGLEAAALALQLDALLLQVARQPGDPPVRLVLPARMDQGEHGHRHQGRRQTRLGAPPPPLLGRPRLGHPPRIHLLGRPRLRRGPVHLGSPQPPLHPVEVGRQGHRDRLRVLRPVDRLGSQAFGGQRDEFRVRAAGRQAGSAHRPGRRWPPCVAPPHPIVPRRGASPSGPRRGWRRGRRRRRGGRGWRRRRWPARAACRRACPAASPPRCPNPRRPSRLRRADHRRLDLGGWCPRLDRSSSAMPPSARTLARPQSITCTSPKAPTMMLAGLMSRWITPLAWA